MEYLIGITLALALVALAGITGLADERSFYPTVTMVVASYYVLFATMGSDHHAVLPESLAGGAFVLLAVLGFKTRLEYVVIALVGHGIFDLIHPHIIANAGFQGGGRDLVWPSTWSSAASYCCVFGATACWLRPSPRVSFLHRRITEHHDFQTALHRPSSKSSG